MASTDKKVGYSPTGNLADVTPDMAASGIEGAFRMLEGRWKMIIIFQLFARGTLRFSELERAIPTVSQKMLIQQLRELERDEIITRTVYPQVPPKVEYDLTGWGEAMCPALDSLLEWAALQPERSPRASDSAEARKGQKAQTTGRATTTQVSTAERTVREANPLVHDEESS
jgi:DNA-binding HxlR family transcriptional regulator